MSGRRILVSIGSAAMVVASVVPVPRSASAAFVAHDPPTPPVTTDTIGLVEAHEISLGGVRYTVSTYQNDAYRCGRESVPVRRRRADRGRRRPRAAVGAAPRRRARVLRQLGRYVTTSGEDHNDAVSTGELLQMLYRYTGPDGRRDTFIGDRVRAAAESSSGRCATTTSTSGSASGTRTTRTTTTPSTGCSPTSRWSVRSRTARTVSIAATRRHSGSSAPAGAFGANALAHNLWVRDAGPQLDVSGVVLDSGLLVPRLLELPAGDPFADDEFVAKHGAYVIDADFWIDTEVGGRGFVPLFDTVHTGDRSCSGHTEPIAAAAFGGNCAWVHAELADAIARGPHGGTALQQVDVYPGTTHAATDHPGTAVQDDLCAWYAAATSDGAT